MGDPLDLLDVRGQLSDEECAVQDSVARFVAAEVLPIIGEAFDAGRFPRELVRPMAELGLLGSSLEGWGCPGLGPVAYGLICQEIERGDSALRSFVSVQSSLVMWPIHTYGSEAQKTRWLPALARGDAIGCFGLSEAAGGSDPASMRTRARRDGSDWILDGSKTWISNGSIADCALIWARSEEGVRGFLVERGTPGFTATDIGRKYSLRAAVTSTLHLDTVRVPAEQMLPGALGLRAALSCLSEARYGICWGAVGAASACLAESMAYTGERLLFGRPLAHTQSVQQRLADMARQLATARLLALHLGRLKQADTVSPVQVSLAKWNNVRMALELARECRDLLGAAGITSAHQAIRHMLNLESVITYEGTETIHQLVVGQALTGQSAF